MNFIKPFTAKYEIDQQYAYSTEFFVFLSACKKSGSNNIKIEGFYCVDLSGNPIFQIGPADEDWTFMTDLSTSVYYSLSAKNHPDYKVGFGDIRVCDNGGMDARNCF